MLSSSIEDIKSRLDIVEVISGYVKLQKAGANYRTNCPFHTEKTPSFFVSPARQMWHCFGCGAGHSVFDFVMKIEGIEFGDALRILAQKAGVELKPFRPEMKELTTARHHLYEIAELATKFFEKQLAESKVGLEAKKYLLNRGINQESIQKWRIGYAPDSWQGLTDFLTGKGYRKEEIVSTGLATRKNDGSCFDRFRARIIFPVFDLNSQVVGFGGRIFETDKKKEEERRTTEGKYVNTPNTLIYDKSRILYGLDKAKVEVRKKDNCILVEGYTDAVLAQQAGTLNVAAVSGTALTPWHLKILRRYTENLLISFDMDLAGDTATKRGIDLALGQGFNIKVVTLPEGKDPADLVVKSPGAWEKAVEQAKSILEFYFETTLNKFDKAKIEGKKEISKILLPLIKKIPNKIEQTFWRQRLVQEIGAKEEDLIEEMNKIKLEEEILGLEPEEIINLPQKSRRDLIEERLMTLILKNRKNLEVLSKEDLDYLLPETKKIVSVFQKAKDNEEALKKISQENEAEINYLILKAEILDEISQKDQDIDFKDCLREIKNLEIKKKLEGISQELRTAETEKNSQKISLLINEFHQLAKKLSEDKIYNGQQPDMRNRHEKKETTEESGPEDEPGPASG
ncbi:MAG: DNA primase [bacterium]|nr:DNA primase [bacterium]